MAGREREVSLAIKAKDQSKKAIDSVAEALRDLEAAQSKVNDKSGKSTAVVDRLKAAYVSLENEIKALGALNKVAQQMDRAAKAVGTLDAQAKASAASQEKLSQEVAKAAANTERLASESERAKAAYEKQRAAVNNLTADQKKNKATTEAERKSRDDLRETLTRAQTATKQAERAEADLRDQLERTKVTTEAQQVALAEANAELEQIAALANRASSALGGVKATQEAVAAASAKAAGEMQRLGTVMVTPKGATGPVNVAGTKNALSNWRAAEAEVRALAVAMKAVDQPTEQMTRDFAISAAAAKNAKEQYQQMRMELAQVRAARVTSGGAPVVPTAMPSAAPSISTAGATNISSALGGTAKSATSVREAFRAIYGESRQAMNFFQRMRGEVLALTSSYIGLYAAIQGVGKVIQVAIAYQGAVNKLSVVFGDNTAAIQSEMGYLEAEANRLGIQFTTLANQYASFAVAAQGANFSLLDTRRIFKSVAEAGVVMNTTNEDMQGIFKALEQIMSKGKIQAEELRGQLGDRMTGAFRLMADALGVTTAELDNMLKAGEVVADRSTLLSFADRLTDKYGNALPKALVGLNAEIGRFQNNMTEAAKVVGESGLTAAITDAVGRLNVWFRSTDGIKFFQGIGTAAAKFAGFLPALVENIDLIVKLFQVFAGFKISQVIMGLIGNFKGLEAVTLATRMEIARLAIGMEAFGAVTGGVTGRAISGMAAGLVALRGVAAGAITVFRGMWAAIGGWPGLIITVLTTIATMVLPGMISGTDKATEALRRHEEMVGKVRDAYHKADGDAQKWAKTIEGVSVSQAQSNLLELTKQLAEYRKELELAREVRQSGFDGASRTEWAGNDLKMLRDRYNDLTVAFKAGKISAEAYKAGLDAITQALPAGHDELRKMLVAQQDSADKGVELEKAMRVSAAAIDAIRGVADGTTASMLGLTDSVDALNGSLDTGAVDNYAAAMDRLASKIPTLKQAKDLADGLAGVKSDYAQGAEGIYQNHTGNTKATLPAYLLQPEHKDELAQILGPVAKKELDALHSRTQQANQAVTTSNSPKATRSSGGSKGESQADKQQKFNDYLAEENRQRAFAIEQLSREEREQEVQVALEAAWNKAKAEGVTFSEVQADALRKNVEAEYDQTRAAELRKKIEEATFALAEARGEQLTREQFVMKELGVQRLTDLTAEQQKLAEIEGKIYDIAEVDRNQKALDKRVSGIGAQQQATMDAITFAQDTGNDAAVEKLQEQLRLINAAYEESLRIKLAFWQSQADDPEAQAEVQRIQNVIDRLHALDQKVLITGKEINERLADGAVDGLDKFAAAVANGKNAFEAAGDAFRQFAAEFLRDIAKLILKQIILNALSGNSKGGGGGVGGLISGALNKYAEVHHTGGIAGLGSTQRNVYAAAFGTATRYHGGGVAGLRSDEVAAVLQRGEGVFTKEQMKALGAGQAGGASGPLNVKSVNLFDVGQLSKALVADEAFQKVFLNFVGDNSRAMNSALAR